MISIRSVRPDTLSGRALAVIVSAGEDGVAVEQVVGHVCRPPPMPVREYGEPREAYAYRVRTWRRHAPPVARAAPRQGVLESAESFAERCERVRAANAADLADWTAERGASHNRDRIAVQRAVGRLVELRLVSGRGAPRVAAWAVEAVSSGRFSRRSDPWVALVEDYVGSEAPAVARLLRRVVEESPGSRAALKLTTQGERSYDRAVAGGLLLPPSVKVATEAGVLHVQSWGTS